jgi:hypothetical protein
MGFASYLKRRFFLGKRDLTLKCLPKNLLFIGNAGLRFPEMPSW